MESHHEDMKCRNRNLWRTDSVHPARRRIGVRVLRLIAVSPTQFNFAAHVVIDTVEAQNANRYSPHHALRDVKLNWLTTDSGARV